MKSIAITAFLFIIIMIVILGFIKRRQAHVLIPENRRRHFLVVSNLQNLDDDCEVEIWNLYNIKSSYFDNNETTKTHCKRILFE
jgi:hypothetical protein